MAILKVNINGVTASVGNVTKCKTKVSSAASGILSVRNNLDVKVKYMKNINNRLYSAYLSINEIDKKINELNSFINTAMNSYNSAESRISKLTSINSTVASKSISKDVGVKKKTFNWEKALQKLKVGANAVIASAKDIWAKFKSLFEPGGALYKPFLIIKAVVGIGVNIAIIIGSGVLEVFSGGTATPIAVLTAIYALNDIGSDFANLKYAICEEYEKIDSKNFLKQGVSWAGGKFGELVGKEEVGKKVGEAIYYLGNVTLIFSGGLEAAKTGAKSLKELGKFKKINAGKLIDEVKILDKNVSSSYKSVSKQLNNNKAIEKIKKAMTMDVLDDLKNIKKPSDLSNIQAIKLIREVNWDKTYKFAYKTVVTKPLNKIMNKSPNLKVGSAVTMAVKELISSVFDIKGSYGDIQSDMNDFFGRKEVPTNA